MQLLEVVNHCPGLAHCCWVLQQACSSRAVNIGPWKNTHTTAHQNHIHEVMDVLTLFRTTINVSALSLVIKSAGCLGCSAQTASAQRHV